MAPADHVHDWLQKLGVFIAPSMTRDEFAGRLNVLAPALAEEFDASLFTPDTARIVARQCKFFPNFAEICTALEPLLRQQRENRRLLALPPPRSETREPYVLPTAPEWCFERKPRLLGSRNREEIAELVQPPARTVAQQYAELTGCSIAEAQAALGKVPADA